MIYVNISFAIELQICEIVFQNFWRQQAQYLTHLELDRITFFGVIKMHALTSENLKCSILTPGYEVSETQSDGCDRSNVTTSDQFSKTTDCQLATVPL